MGTPQNLSSEWAKWVLTFGFWDFQFLRPPQMYKKINPSKTVECLGRGSCENGECWQEALVLLLSGTQGGLFPLGIKHGW